MYKFTSFLALGITTLGIGGVVWAQDRPSGSGGALGSGANLGSLLGNLGSSAPSGTGPFSQGLGQVVSGWTQQGIRGQDLSERIHWLQEMRRDEMAERMRRFDQDDRWRDIRDDRREIRDDERRLREDERRLNRDREDLRRDLREPDSRSRDRDIREDRREIRDDERRLLDDERRLGRDREDLRRDTREDRDPRHDRDDRLNGHDRADFVHDRNEQRWSDHRAGKSDFGQHIGSLAGKKDNHPAFEDMKKNVPNIGESRPNISLPTGKGKGKGKG